MERQSTVLLTCLSFYLLLVRTLRYRRREALKTKYGMRHRQNFSTLTADQAQDILKDLVEMEFPKLMGFSIVFALFKTCGIPSVSSLLVRTGELAGPETASKRTADTGVLILEFCLNKPSSERAMEAVARMNYLHSRYVKAGKISNDDIPYTLSVFALEPVRWVKKYEWRELSDLELSDLELSDLELCATGTFWKAMGDKMGISFEGLPSRPKGLHWLEEAEEWSEEYEQRCMVPVKTNHDLALAHLDVIFINLPPRFNTVGKYVVSVLVGERLRKAMMLPDPPRYYTAAIENFLFLRRLVLRHLALPRLELQRKKYISSAPEANGRYSSREYLSHPWYVKPTFKRRWGGRVWMTWLLGRKLPGDDGNKYNPEGYLISEVEPAKMAGSGVKEMKSDLERIRQTSPGGCPFSGWQNAKSA